MLINADFSRRASVASDEYQWVSSPGGEVQRVMLDRVGQEVARATSIVRYEPDSSFPHHTHPEGEEILVLSGTFSDKSGHYPAGWYIRNPPGSGHEPFSAEGAIIFVKLRQMPLEERQQVRIDTNDASVWQHQDEGQQCPLFSSDYENVCLLKRLPGALMVEHPDKGAELLVLQGDVILEGQPFSVGSWIRLPSNDPAQVVAGPDGATVYLKTDHLAS